MYQNCVGAASPDSFGMPSEYSYYAQLLENAAIDFYNSQKIVGVNRPEERSVLESNPAPKRRGARPALPVLNSKPTPKSGSARPSLSPTEREAIRSLVISGKISPSSPAALVAAEEDR